MKMVQIFLMSLFLMVGLVSTAYAQQPILSSNFVTIDYPEASRTWAMGINNNGQIVGTYRGTDLINHGFLLSSGNYTTIDYPGSNDTIVEGINDVGEIVGSYGDSSKTFHGFLLSSGNYTTIDYPGSAATRTFGINKAGDIVGTYIDSSDHTHGFLLSSDKYTTIDYSANDPTSTPSINNSDNNIDTFLSKINNAKQIVGSWNYRSRDTAFLGDGFVLSSGNYTTIDPRFNDTSCVTNTLASGINNVGQIVGFCYDRNWVQYYNNFVFSSGTYMPINYKGPISATPSDINDAGQIVGSYEDPQHQRHGFLLPFGTTGTIQTVPEFFFTPFILVISVIAILIITNVKFQNKMALFRS